MSQQPNPQQPLILAVDTATRAGGVALVSGETALAARSGDVSVSHSTNLIEMIQEILEDTHTKLAVVDLFAVAIGPGSFTGLRIGLATVKAFAIHLDRQVAGVSTLAAVAHASAVEGELVSLLPAGRGEVFAQLFLARDGEITELDQPQHLTPRAVMDKYPATVPFIFAGDAKMAEASFGVPPSGGNPCEPVRPQAGTPNRVIVLEKPLAPAIARLGYRAHREGKSIAADDLRAAYVRASDAEINERWQRLKAQPQG